jgi:hypothetical protein
MKYEKLTQIGKKAIISLAVIYGLNFTGQGINYLVSNSKLNETKKKLLTVKEKWDELPYVARRGYGYTISGGLGWERDCIYLRLKDLEEKKSSLEKRVQDSKRKMITVF